MTHLRVTVEDVDTGDRVAQIEVVEVDRTRGVASFTIRAGGRMIGTTGGRTDTKQQLIELASRSLREPLHQTTTAPSFDTYLILEAM